MVNCLKNIFDDDKKDSHRDDHTVGYGYNWKIISDAGTFSNQREGFKSFSKVKSELSNGIFKQLVLFLRGGKINLTTEIYCVDHNNLSHSNIEKKDRLYGKIPMYNVLDYTVVSSIEFTEGFFCDGCAANTAISAQLLMEKRMKKKMAKKKRIVEIKTELWSTIM